MSETYHYFIPFIREGFASMIKDSAEGNGAKHELIVARTEPEPDTGDFEAERFPIIEFTEPGFLWRYSPESAAGSGKLQPWITLIVLISESQGDKIQKEFTESMGCNPGLSPYIELKDSSVLPKLEDAWRWAHAQITAEEQLDDQQLKQLTRNETKRAICRLIYPRKLKPGIHYSAFVVPTFKLRMMAGLGITSDNDKFLKTNALELAWLANSRNIKLPYYYRWNFRTSSKS